VALELADFLARGGVPQPRRFVIACREHLFAVGGEDRSVNLARVALEVADFFARGGVPQPRRPVPACREHQFAVGGEDRAENIARVALELVDLPRAQQVPSCQQSVQFSGVPGARVAGAGLSGLLNGRGPFNGGLG
jgi:hypothetical protein